MKFNFLVSSNPHSHSVLNEKYSSRMNFRILITSTESTLEDEYHEELNLLSHAIITRKYTNTLRDEYGSPNSENWKEEDLEMLKDDVKKLRAIFSKTLNKNIDEGCITQDELRKAGFIGELLDFIQVQFHHQIIHQGVPEHLGELELHCKLILNFYRARYLESMAECFLLKFGNNSSKLKKLSEMNVPEIYQYYKERVQYTHNEFKEMYKILSDRNDKVEFNVFEK
jgi:hypothetical protein